jgi:uncharacterized protein
MRLSDEVPKSTPGAKPEQRANRPGTPRSSEVRKPQEDRRSVPPMNNAMAEALRKLKG